MMLAKIFSFILGIFTVFTPITHSPAPTATTTPKLPDSILEKSASTTPAKLTATSTTQKPQPKTPVKISKPVAPIPTAIKNPEITSPKVATSTPPPVPTDYNLVNQKSRQALVNILCTSTSGGFFEPLSGSGVIIDPRGIILTNAHVAQYLLLEDSIGNNLLNCVARIGSPAVPTYRISVLYISPQWVAGNYKNLRVSSPTGTGENDYALIKIIGNIDPDIVFEKPLPFLKPEYNDVNIHKNNPVILAAYPAGFLGGIGIQKDLYVASTIINLKEVYTFKTGAIDILDLGGSPVAQHGSSGGAVVNTDGKLIGIIVTSTDAPDTADRDLNAISTSYINRNLYESSGISLEILPKADLNVFSTQFNKNLLPNIKKLLFEGLNPKN